MTAAPYHQDNRVTLHHGDCLDVMAQLADNSVDSIVTDPPYGLGFMGKAWDDLPPGEDWARECLRVLKPGGHLLAFGGTRTWHRLACAVEDAGFEVRDSIAWLYGSGFSKSWNFKTMYKGEWCSCATENALPYNHADNTDLPRVRDDVHPPAVARSEGDDGLLLPEMQRGGEGSGLGDARTQGPRSMVAGSGSLGGCQDDGRAEPGMGGRLVPRAGQGLQDDSEAGSPEGASEWLRRGTPAGDGSADRAASDATPGSAPHQRRQGGQPTGEPEALPGSHVALDDGALRDGAVCARCGGLDQVYQGFGTGIKPAFEPVVVARKPLVGTVAANVQAWGTGALNIDGTRIGTGEDRSSGGAQGSAPQPMSWGEQTGRERPSGGRWPANVILDEDMAAVLDEQSGTSKDGVAVKRNRPEDGRAPYAASSYMITDSSRDDHGYGGQGGASRFFYVAKAPKRERPVVDGVAHPTVKPLALMRWLVRLVTPPGGTVLEPFAGSGTTVEACLLEGFQCIAIEKGDEYLPLILARIQRQSEPLPEAAELVRTVDEDAAILEQIAGQLDIFGEGVT